MEPIKTASELVKEAARRAAEQIEPELELHPPLSKSRRAKIASIIEAELADTSTEAANTIATLKAERDEYEQRVIEVENRLRTPSGNFPCLQCGGPHDFDTSVPSAVWNATIRAKKLPEYLCLTCIVREFVREGKGFTAQLWNEEFNGVPIEIVVNGQNANDAAEISDENTAYRVRIRELETTAIEAAKEIIQLAQADALTEAKVTGQAEMKAALITKIEKLLTHAQVGGLKRIIIDELKSEKDD